MGNLEYQGMFGILLTTTFVRVLYGITISPTDGYWVVGMYKCKWTFFLKGCQIVGHVRNDSHFRSAVVGCWVFRESCR